MEEIQPLGTQSRAATADIGFLLVGHGTRNPRGQEQLKQLFLQFELLVVPYASALGFLELAEPDIPAAVERLVLAGVRRLVTVPVLLFSAGHAQRDIPEAVRKACETHGIEPCTQTQPFETAEAILRLSATRFHEAIRRSPAQGVLCPRALEQLATAQGEASATISNHNCPHPDECPLITGVTKVSKGGLYGQNGGVVREPPENDDCPQGISGATQVFKGAEEFQSGGVVPALPENGECPQSVAQSVADEFCPQTALLMVGRGSSSTAAAEKMREFTRLRCEVTNVANSETCFIHGQTPSVPMALDALQASDLPIAVVQPHLLFEGELVNNLRCEVARRQALDPIKRWVITDTLGVDEKLAEALAELARAEIADVENRT